MPYIDQPIPFWERLFDGYSKWIKLVYLPIPGFLSGSGRPLQPGKYTLDFLNSRLFPVSMLVNPIVLHQPAEVICREIIGTLRMVLEKWHVSEFTVSNLNLAHTIKEAFPNLPITASTLTDVFSPLQVIYLDDIDVIVPSTRITRDVRALRALKNAFSGKCRLMVNEACLPSCPFRIQHFYEMSCPAFEYPRSLCESILKNKPWLRLTGAWILPQHLHLFDGLYDELKLVGRISLFEPNRYVDVLDHYVHKEPLLPNEIGGGPAAVPFPLDISQDFYHYTLTCSKLCSRCNICREYWPDQRETF